MKAKKFAGKVLNRLPVYIQPMGYLPAPREVTYGKYREMAQNDATVSACLEFVVTSALTRLGEYHHENVIIQDFVRANFELMRGSFYDFCREALSCLWAGFSVAEIVTEMRGDMVWLHSLPVLPAETLTFHVNEDCSSVNYGEIDYIIQRPYQQNEAILPLDKCIILRNQYSGAVVQDPYGMSRLRVVETVYDSKKKAERDWADALTRFATPFIDYAMENPNESVTVEDSTMPAWQAANDQLNNFGTKSSAFIHGKDNEIQFIMPPHDVSNDYERLIENYSRQIMRGLLIPSLLFDAGDHGSYALGREHMALYQESLSALLNNLTETILDQLIRPLVTVNFGVQSDWGYFDIKQSNVEQTEIATLYMQLLQLGVYDPTNADDVNTLRRRFGLSEIQG